MPALSGSGLPRVKRDILPLIQAKLNDATLDPQSGETVVPAVFTDTALLPFLNSAYRQLQRDLVGSGVKFTYVDSDPIVLLPGDRTLTDLPNGTETDHLLLINPAGDPADVNNQMVPGQSIVSALPVDFLWVEKVWEQPASSFDAGTKWTEMVPAYGGLPQRAPREQLEVYEMLADGLQFVGVTQPTVLRIRHMRRLPILTKDDDSEIRLRDAEEALAALTVSLVARSRGVTALAQDAQMEYEREKARVIAAYFRFQQSSPARRKPYGSRRRVAFQ